MVFIGLKWRATEWEHSGYYSPIAGGHGHRRIEDDLRASRAAISLLRRAQESNVCSVLGLNSGVWCVERRWGRLRAAAAATDAPNVKPPIGPEALRNSPPLPPLVVDNQDAFGR